VPHKAQAIIAGYLLEEFLLTCVAKFIKHQTILLVGLAFSLRWFDIPEVGFDGFGEIGFACVRLVCFWVRRNRLLLCKLRNLALVAKSNGKRGCGETLPVSRPAAARCALTEASTNSRRYDSMPSTMTRAARPSCVVSIEADLDLTRLRLDVVAIGGAEGCGAST
jgi:hypothetical protein